MPWRLNQASGFRQQGKYNRTSAAERSEIRREAVRPLPLQDAPPCPGLAHPGFHSKSSLVFFPLPSHQPMKIHRVIPEEPESAKMRARATTLQPCPKCGQAPKMDKFFDIIGRLAPFAYFIVVCDCGAHSRPKRNVYLAEREWNKNGPIVTRKPSNLRGRLMLYVVLPDRKSVV